MNVSQCSISLTNPYIRSGHLSNGILIIFYCNLLLNYSPSYTTSTKPQSTFLSLKLLYFETKHTTLLLVSGENNPSFTLTLLSFIPTENIIFIQFLTGPGCWWVSVTSNQALADRLWSPEMNVVFLSRKKTLILGSIREGNLTKQYAGEMNYVLCGL